MRIGVIGGGISGLSGALELARKGCHVEVFERSDGVGGLAAAFDFDGTPAERYYHFLCAHDTGYFDLCRQLGLDRRLHWTRPRTGFHYEGRTYGFTSPVDLLRFRPIPLWQRVRFGLLALEARHREEWRQLDELTARPWLIDRIGQRAYDVIWHPLLALKFGERYDAISAAWVRHRLHRVANSRGRMGYLDGGSALLFGTLLETLRAHGAVVHTGREVKRILTDNGRAAGLEIGDGDVYECDRVLSAVPLPVLADCLDSEWAEYAAQLRRIDYIGVVCVVLKLARPVSRYFWLNVNDSQAPFNGIIEYTNLNAIGDDAGHIVYVPYYVATNTTLYQSDDETVFNRSWDAVKRIAAELSDADVIASRVFRDPYAQAVCTTGFLDLQPEHRAPIEGLYLVDSTHLYPADRTQSGLIRCAQACAGELVR
ncbi:MAG TPA: NAD(P)/FAD-dependent oxidoreductase [Candidatus Hydrogenedentes bacterium]|nr:NAD(P)/FAD-dependent oxidoreductase [Candidatus Hydrogenedentota bacterium]